MERHRKPQSSIQKLGVEELVNDLLEAGVIYDDIQQTVFERTTHRISKAALSRYHTKWSSVQERMSRAYQEAEVLAKVVEENSGVNLGSAAMGLLMQKIVKKLADAEASLDEVDIMEVAKVMLKAVKIQSDQSGPAAIDRPSVYLECLNELTDYLTNEAPSALEGLAENLDGFMGHIRKSYATTH